MRTSEKIFENNGYQINRVNRCCVCGSDQDLSRHHIIPSCFIKALKPEIKEDLKKDHPFYYEWDYSCLCGECHDKYEKNYGNNLQILIWDMYGVDLRKTSYKDPHSTLPKPSEVVMMLVKTKEDFIELRDFCIEYFKEKMSPKFDLI